MGNLSKNFSRHEFACKCGCGFDTVDTVLIDVLQDIADHFKASVTVNSGCRCVEHNETIQHMADINYVPYSSRSVHMTGKAADIVIAGIPAIEVCKYLDYKYPHQFGLGLYSSWVHIDVRSTPARWGIHR